MGFQGDDEALLEAARSCKKTGGRFRSLFDVGGIPVGSRSEADIELCDMLAYWCDCDAERMKRLFRESALAQGKYAEKGRQGERILISLSTKPSKAAPRPTTRHTGRG
jgi:primase-polymerase (primpol)-like protein